MQVINYTISKELSILDLCNEPVEGIIAGPVNEDNFFEWEAIISGPADTIYEGGIFTARLEFPMDYPLNPPKMRFLTEMWHPNSKNYLVL